MIFSRENCPICGQKLKSEFIHLTGAPNSQTSIFYSCPKNEIVRNQFSTACIVESHYTNEVFDYYYDGLYGDKPLGQLCRMIIPPYILDHSSRNHMTSVSINRHEIREPQKLIFRIPLLDIDYSQPHIVVSKLKVLVTFS